MKNISKLNSGETYTLSQIFSNDFTIAIPDLQRDYCWGLETYDNKGVQPDPKIYFGSQRLHF